MTSSNLKVTETNLSNLKCGAAIHCVSGVAPQSDEAVFRNIYCHHWREKVGQRWNT